MRREMQGHGKEGAVDCSVVVPELGGCIFVEVGVRAVDSLDVMQDSSNKTSDDGYTCEG